MGLHGGEVVLRRFLCCGAKLLQTGCPRLATVPPSVSYSTGETWGQNEFPKSFGQRMSIGGPRTTNANTSSPPWATQNGVEEVKGDSTVEDNTFPKAPSSHESPSIFYDPLALKFINMLMKDGKKSQASKVFTQALGIIKRTQIAKEPSENLSKYLKKEAVPTDCIYEFYIEDMCSCRVAASGDGENVILNPVVIFHKAVENVKPAVSTQTIRKGGKSYHVPCSITAHRRIFLACKWIIVSVRQKNRGMGTAKKLAIDLLDSYNQQGSAIKKRQDLHRLADANRAYSHFRW